MKCLKHNLLVCDCSKCQGKMFKEVCDDCMKGDGDCGDAKAGSVDFGKEPGRGIGDLMKWILKNGKRVTDSEQYATEAE